jgi:hypothetical protein
MHFSGTNVKKSYIVLIVFFFLQNNIEDWI